MISVVAADFNAFKMFFYAGEFFSLLNRHFYRGHVHFNGFIHLEKTREINNFRERYLIRLVIMIICSSIVSISMINI